MEINNLNKYFGGLGAIKDLNLQIEGGEIRGIIGPNGSGKTTLFNVITGFYKPTKGEIKFQGEEIARQSSYKISKKGMIRTFQRDALFQEFSVLKNVKLAQHLHSKKGVLPTLFGIYEKQKENEIYEILDFIGLYSYKDEPSINLSHGHKRSLGLAIALAAKPKLLMIDEPTAGMNPIESEHMASLVRKIRDERNITVILVEHDMKVVMDLCDNISVLNFGNKLAEGSPEEIQNNSEVIEAYLGGEEVVSLLEGKEGK